mgnify:FL=1
MKKLVLAVFFFFNMIVVYGAVENNFLISLNTQDSLSLELLTGLLAFSVFGLFSIELYKNRKNKI